MKKLLFVLPLFSLTIQSAYAVKTASLIEDEKSLEVGRNARAVASVNVLLNNKSLCPGSCSLVTPDIILTSAHMFLSHKDELIIVPGIPTKVSGFVTFAADATQAISDFESDPSAEKLATFYELDSVIIHRDYTDGFADPHDIAFARLKRSVEGIDPLPLYSKGIIPESKLKIHNMPLAMTNESMSLETLLIDAYGYGYGNDTNQQYGKRRGVYLPTFIGLDNTPFENDSSEASGNEDTSTSIDIDVEEVAIANEGEAVSLTSYFPAPNVMNSSSFLMSSKTHEQFYDRLYECVKEKDEPSGLIDGGDSGGPLIVSGKIVGVNGCADNTAFYLEKVQDFSDVSRLRFVNSYAAPLFNYKTGELRPELPEMIEILQAHPLSNESDLENLLLLRQRQKRLQTEACTLAISDLEKLILPDLSLEGFESIISKYSDPENKVSIDFEEAASHFKSSEFEAFSNVIQGKIEKLTGFIKELSL